MPGLDALACLARLDADLSQLPVGDRRGLDVIARAASEVLGGVGVSVVTDETDGAPAFRLPLAGGVGSLCVHGAAVKGTPLRILEGMAQRASVVLRVSRELQAMEQALSRKEDELARLHRSALLISSRSNVQTTLDTILQMALEVTGARYGIVRLLSSRGTLVTGSVAGENLDRPLVEALPVQPDTITGWVATHRQPLCIADVREPPWSGLYYPLDRGHAMRAELAVPLLGGGGRVEGVLNLESPRVGAFGESDRLLLQALATQAVIAIQEARLLDALQECAEHLLSWPCSRVLHRLVELARDLLGAGAAAISLADGRAVAAGEPGQTWPRSLEVPIGDGGGTFTVYSPEGESLRPEAEWDRKVLVCLAHYAALALENETRTELLQRTREQRAVAEMFAAVGDVAANLLHQLNNKIGIIPVRVQNVLDKCEPDAYLARQLSEIQKSAQDAIAVTRENLKLLRPGENRSIRLSSCIEQALRMLHAAGSIHIQVEGVEDLPAIQGEEGSVTLVFLNLLENAVSAMGGSGRLHLRGSQAGRVVRVAITDTGPGIAPELQERVFEFNFSGRPHKFGFGLWWVRTHMTRLGGAVTVESEPGHGTTFRLAFPLP